MIDVEPVIAAELERMVPLPDGGRADWSDVLGRAASARAQRRWRSVLVAAVAVAALVGVGVAIAAGFGAFNGISAAQNKPTGAHVLPPALRARLRQLNATNAKLHAPDHLLLDTARVVGTMPDGSKVYGLTDTRGDLCTVGEVGGGCGPPLSHSDPITAGGALPREGGTFIFSGLAIDGVTSVSFTLASGKEVTVPVKHNVWVYERKHANGVATNCIEAHFADGSIVRLPNAPCP